VCLQRCLLFSLAIKMGRIPKAEKLRALENAYGDLAAAVAAVAASSSSSAPSAVSTHAPMVAAAADSHSPSSSSGPSAAASIASDGALATTTTCATGVEPVAGATAATTLVDFARQPAVVVVGDCATIGASGNAGRQLLWAYRLSWSARCAVLLPQAERAGLAGAPACDLACFPRNDTYAE